MNVLITGVTSFLGRGIARELLDRGDTVYGLIRSESKNHKDLDVGIVRIICNFCNIERLHTLRNFHVDVLIHLAWDGVGKEGRMNPEIQELNIQNTLRTIEVVKQLGCRRVLFAGSQAEYGFVLEEYREQLLQNQFRKTFEDSYLRFLNLNADASVLADLPANTSGEDTVRVQNSDTITQLDQLVRATMTDEDYPCNPKSQYGMAKLEVWKRASARCRELSMEYIHLRIFSVYGACDHETSLIKTILRAKKSGGPVTLSACNQLWNYLYIQDCADAIADLSACSLEGCEKELIVNVASRDTRIMRAFADAVDKGRGLVRYEEREAASEGTPFLSPSIERLQNLINFREQYTFEEGIKEIERLYNM